MNITLQQYFKICGVTKWQDAYESVKKLGFNNVVRAHSDMNISDLNSHCIAVEIPIILLSQFETLCGIVNKKRVPFRAAKFLKEWSFKRLHKSTIIVFLVLDDDILVISDALIPANYKLVKSFPEDTWYKLLGQASLRPDPCNIGLYFESE